MVSIVLHQISKYLLWEGVLYQISGSQVQHMMKNWTKSDQSFCKYEGSKRSKINENNSLCIIPDYQPSINDCQPSVVIISPHCTWAGNGNLGLLIIDGGLLIKYNTIMKYTHISHNDQLLLGVIIVFKLLKHTGNSLFIVFEI